MLDRAAEVEQLHATLQPTVMKIWLDQQLYVDGRSLANSFDTSINASKSIGFLCFARGQVTSVNCVAWAHLQATGEISYATLIGRNKAGLPARCCRVPGCGSK